MSRMRDVMAIIFVLICLSFPSAHAIPKSNELWLEAPSSKSLTEAAKMFSAIASAYYETGDYDEALINFSMAWDLSRDPMLAYDASLCAWKMDQIWRAHMWIKRALRDSLAPPPMMQKLADRIVELCEEDNRALGWDVRCKRGSVCISSYRWVDIVKHDGRGVWDAGIWPSFDEARNRRLVGK